MIAGTIADRFVVRTAGLAPSVHNTQPWYFTSDQGVIRLYADPARGLPEEDPGGRERVISCGAALCNLKLAVRHLGFIPGVRLLPDVNDGDLLAEVRWGRYLPPATHEEMLYRAIARRHTCRGPFTMGIPPLLTGELVRAARYERADLHLVHDPQRQAELAALVASAEQIQGDDPGVVAERARWLGHSDGSRPDGVRVAGSPARWDGLEFAGRGTGEALARAAQGAPFGAGSVVLLSTRDDRRPGWLLAGVAMQRLLLYATARGIGAAFHTQPLEVPEIRDRIRFDFTGGAYPQVLLRFGCGGVAGTRRRRTVGDTLREQGMFPLPPTSERPPPASP